MTDKEKELLAWLMEAGYKATYNDWFHAVTVLTQEFQGGDLVETMRLFGFSGSFYDLTGIVYSSGDKEIRIYAKTGDVPADKGIYKPSNALAYAVEL